MISLNDDIRDDYVEARAFSMTLVDDNLDRVYIIETSDAKSFKLYCGREVIHQLLGEYPEMQAAMIKVQDELVNVSRNITHSSNCAR